MIKSRTFILLLFLTAIIGAILAPPKSLPVKIFYSSSTGPFNIGWNGTSAFYEKLSDRGYRSVVLHDLRDVIDEGGKIVLIVIAPDTPFSEKEAKFLLEMANDISLRIIVADESRNSNQLLKLFGVEVDGEYLVDESSPYGRLHPPATFRIGNTTYHVILNRASYLNTVEPDILWSEDRFCSGVANGRRVFSVFHNDDDAIAVISDSSTFINLFFKEELLREALPENATESAVENSKFSLDLVDYLTGGDKDFVVAFDISHYRARGGSEIFMRLPLPPIGLVIASFLANLLSRSESYLRSILVTNPLSRVVITLLVALVTYGILRGEVRKRGDDEILPKREEVEILLETPLRRIYEKPEKLPKAEKMRILHDLYTALRILLEKYAGIDAEALEEKGEYALRFRSIMQDEFEAGFKTIRRLRRISEKYEGKRKIIWPPILSWNKEMRALLLSSEAIANKLGTTIIGREGMRGIEYRTRGE